MMTQNCDQAPVFNLMHRRDPIDPAGIIHEAA